MPLIQTANLRYRALFPGERDNVPVMRALRNALRPSVICPMFLRSRLVDNPTVTCRQDVLVIHADTTSIFFFFFQLRAVIFHHLSLTTFPFQPLIASFICSFGCLIEDCLTTFIFFTFILVYFSFLSMSC